MSVINKLIFEIKQEIPKPVLEVAFLKRIGRNSKYAGGLDWEIKNKVIDARVWVDLNFMGGETVKIPINANSVEFLENYDTRCIIRVPKRMLGGRDISQVIAYDYYYQTGVPLSNNAWQSNTFNLATSGNSPVMQVAQKILRSAAPAPITSSANVELIGDNVILLSDYMGRISSGAVVCRLTNDKELSKWNSAAIFQLSQFAIMATKAWIYANTIVDMDQGYLYSGAEIGRIQQIIDGYADANTNYTEYREAVMQAVNFTTDAARHQTFLRSLIAGNS